MKKMKQSLYLSASTAAMLVAAYAYAGGSPQGQSSQGGPVPVPGGTPASSPAPAPAPSTLNDGQVGQVLMSINNAEIAEAQLAQSTSSNQNVLNFANMMVTDHANANNQVQTALDNIGFFAEASTLSDQLDTQSNTELNQLGNLSGTQFDQQYAANQITDHQNALTVIDQLSRMTTTPSVQTLLTNYRATVNTHLTQARALQTGLQAPTPGPSPAASPAASPSASPAASPSASPAIGAAESISPDDK